MKIRQLLFLAAMTMSLSTMAQSRYCSTWQDYLDGQWREAEGPVELLPSSKEDRLALEVKASKKTSYTLRKRACVLICNDSLYLNLRPFNTFGDVYVQAWPLGDKLLFARQDVAPSRFSIANGDSGIPVSGKSFRSLSKLENLVCYVAVWDPNRDELRMARVTAEIVDKLLTNHPDQLNQYRQMERSQREQADTVISLLHAAGVI